MVKVKVRQRGGKRLARLLREAGKGGVKSVQVGFFSTAKYQDGTPVAAVAAWNEFGTKNIPKNIPESGPSSVRRLPRWRTA